MFSLRHFARHLTGIILLCMVSIPSAFGEAPVIINEFLAKNTSGLKDEDGDYSDWIELFNRSTNVVNLGGWYLTDSAKKPTKWRIPSTNMEPNGFLIVFASGKDRAVPGLPLHANFSLDASGEYLALLEPDGTTIASQFSPTYPEQYSNMSYGIGQETEMVSLISSNAPTQVFVPSNNNLGLTWTAENFNDSAWQSATNGVGYESYVTGFSVKNIRANITVGNLDTTLSVLSDASKQKSVFTANPSVINYVNTGDGSHFGNDASFPGFTIGVDEDNFVMQATGIITIPISGYWTFGVNSDDGFSVTIGTNTFSYADGRGPSDSLAVFKLNAGDYPVNLVYFEIGGGSEVEFFAARGSYASYNTTFALVGNTNGLAVKSLGSTSSSTSLSSLIQTDVKNLMYSKAPSACLRIPFTATNPAEYSSLMLRVRYNDGYVAWLNGTEVARRNFTGTPQWNSTATTTRDINATFTPEDVDISQYLGLLTTGTNILAIQGFNESTNGGQFFVQAQLMQYKVLAETNHYFAQPTPGAFNSLDLTAFVGNLHFSPNRGWFQNTNFSVAITCDTPGATIYYTTNGSTPSSSNGFIYSGSIPVSSTKIIRAVGCLNGFDPSTVETHSYLFLDQIQKQTTNVNYIGGSSSNYTLNTNITLGVYKDLFASNLLSIPTLSIAIASDDFFGANGIWSNPTGTGDAWERVCSAEYMRPDGKSGFHVNCGLRIQGGVSRTGIEKHSLRLLFKSAYGPSKLNYSIFPDSSVTSFDTLALHAGFNDHWLWGGDQATLHRDQFSRDTQNDMGGYAGHGTYVHLYIDGIYWGVYDIGEKSDDSFAASYLGGDKSEYDAFTPDEVIAGTYDAYNTLLAIANAGITNDVAYTNISKYLDIPNFINYMLMNFYGANTDWPVHNWNAARRQMDGAGLHFFSWDAEWVLGIQNTPTTDRTGVGASDGVPSAIYAGLRQHSEFCRLFGDLAQKYCFNGGALTPEKTLARWNARSKELDLAVIGETARWGNGYTRDTWLAAEANVRSWFPTRTATLISQLRAAKLYPSINAPDLIPFGGLIPVGSSLVLSNSNSSGYIFYTIDGSDPRLWGGLVSSSAIRYTGPISPTNAVTIRARVRQGATWSALVEASFYLLQDYSNLALTEIMYAPPAIGTNASDEYEFIELRNTGTNTLDLTGLKFTSGIDFAFTNGTLLNAGEYFVLARNATAFAEKYPGVTINGTYTGKLNNSGDTLTLSHILGTEVFSVSYDSQPPWPATPNGLGYSLVRNNLSGDLNTATSWRASTNPGGSPGADDPSPKIPHVVINEILSRSTIREKEFIELYNFEATNASVAGWFLSDDISQPMKFRLPNDAVIPANGYLTYTSDDFNSNPGVSPSFGLSSSGETLYLFSGSASDTNVTGYSHGVTFGAAASGISFGRYVASTGEEQWPALISLTKGATNTAPRVGPIVINEINYNPVAGADEFVELYNLDSTNVPLFDAANPSNGWKLKGIDYTFTNQTMAAGSYLLLVKSDPNTFRTKYNVPADVTIAGPYEGNLQGNGEKLTLQRPETSGTNVLYIVVDEVRYDNKAPWPTAADGEGPSLQRRHFTDYGNEPTNWFASGITPGTANAIDLAPICKLTSPSDGSVFDSSSTISLSAVVIDPDSAIGRVEFYDGSELLATLTNSPFVFTWTNADVGSHALMAKAYDAQFASTASTPIQITVNAPAGGSGTGLLGTYFNNMTLSGTSLTRTDAMVNFDWGSSSPMASINVDGFSVRWTGMVQPQFSGTYTFYTLSDDGVRLYVNNQLLVNNWTDHSSTENSGTISLVAGKLYPIKMEFYENGGNAIAELFWSCASLTKELIPTSQLYLSNAGNQPPTVTLTAPAPNSVFITGSSTVLKASAYDDVSVARVDFYGNGNKLGSAITSPYTLDWNNLSAGTVMLTAVATDSQGLSQTSSPVTITITNGITTNIVFLETNSVWRFDDSGTVQKPTWSLIVFDDHTWAQGTAPLGYGNGVENTIVGYGSNAASKNITTYFRQAFNVQNAASCSALNLHIRAEDGDIVFLNGIPVYQFNLPTGTISNTTPALTNVVNIKDIDYVTASIDANVLIDGTNVVAVETHLASHYASSMLLDLVLDATQTIISPNILIQPQSVEAEVGDAVELSASVTGTAPLTYRWLFNNAVLPNATNVNLVLSNIQLTQAGDYQLIVANSGGSVTSTVATIIVTVADSDGDGMPDNWEIAHGLNPQLNDANLDADGDGMSNLQEYLAGTDPQDASSNLKLTLGHVSSLQLNLEFQAVSNRSYTIQTRTDLEAGPWTTFTNISSATTNRAVVVPLVPAESRRFYRISVP